MPAKIKMWLAIAALLIATVLIVGLFFIELPTGNRDMIGMGLGAAIGWASATINYYFGDSAKDNRP